MQMFSKEARRKEERGVGMKGRGDGRMLGDVQTFSLAHFPPVMFLKALKWRLFQLTG